MDIGHICDVLGDIDVDVSEGEVLEILLENWGTDFMDKEDDELITFLFDELT